ncbi:unnamed protein product [Gongylonema pulchrum]|uniref:tRNA pseudouridine(38-40) synthase n=1 Tax=Gongylonema pulchrum TaxID=637853 RepID=A0A183DV61_9BILA|nr:unnamed protein product [Gongylonema pulchrum]
MCGQVAWRYLLWASYDGARFVSISNKSANHGVLGFLQSLLCDAFPDIGGQFKMSPSSRTDVGVHAARNAFIVQIPIENADREKHRLLDGWNRKIHEYATGSLRILDFHSVSRGFCSRRNVSYRFAFSAFLTNPRNFAGDIRVYRSSIFSYVCCLHLITLSVHC